MKKSVLNGDAFGDMTKYLLAIILPELLLRGLDLCMKVLDGHLLFLFFEMLAFFSLATWALASSKVTGDFLDSISIPNLALS
jgi:hypothetical protein